MTRVVWLLVVGVLVALGLSSPASAGNTVQPPQIAVATGCVDGQGVITVTIVDGTLVGTYDVLIDDSFAGQNLGQGTYDFSPYAAGDHLVDVYIVEDPTPVYSDTWTVGDCSVATTTTAVPTTSAAGSGAAVPTTAAAALPATGQASRSIALIALLLTALGGALLFIVAQARRA